MASASERGLPFRALPYTGVRCLIVPTLAARSILDEMSSSGPLRILHHSLSGISPTTRRQAAECAIGAWCEGSDLHLFEDLCRHLQVWEQARAADPDGNPLSPLDTLILHELTEMAAIRTGLPPEAAHVVASVMERMCARAVELADAAAYLLRRTAGCSRPGADRDTRSTGQRRREGTTGACRRRLVDESPCRGHTVAAPWSAGHRSSRWRAGSGPVSGAWTPIARSQYRLPDIDGLALLESLRERPGQAETPAIIVTGDRTPDSILKARKLGVSDYLTKPVDRKDLTQRIKRLLDDG